MAQRRVLKKEDTVLLGEAVQNMKLEEKSVDAQWVDFVFRASHVWSQRHPERAKECFHDNVETNLVSNNIKFTGLPGFVAIAFNLHDTFESTIFHIVQLST